MSFSVVISGAGLAGLSLAVQLKHHLQGAVHVTMCDPVLPPATNRVYALTPASIQYLDSLGVWQDVRDKAQPITNMDITDSHLEDAVRPHFLTFADHDPLAFILESQYLASRLYQVAQDKGVELLACKVDNFQTHKTHVNVVTQNGAFTADLLIGADGAQSFVREHAGIGWITWDYPQTGLVATIRHEKDHEGKAQQHFLPSGPFAMLPLTSNAAGHRSSIVWSEDKNKAQHYLELPEHAQLSELEMRFGLELGAISFASPLTSHPLRFGMARNMAKDRIALVGDAAHIIHPIAGQGLNLGLQDAQTLGNLCIKQLQLGLIPGPAVLKTYEQIRRFQNVRIGLVTDGLNRLFSNDRLAVRLMRDLGLGLVERMPALKKAFIKSASGF